MNRSSTIIGICIIVLLLFEESLSESRRATGRGRRFISRRILVSRSGRETTMRFRPVRDFAKKMSKRHARVGSNDAEFLRIARAPLTRPFCSRRRDVITNQRLPCCTGRDDECALPYHDTTCYCDQFCYRSNDADCCPDYIDYCFDAGFGVTTTKLPTPEPTTTVTIKPTTTTTTRTTTITSTTKVTSSTTTLFFTEEPDAAQEGSSEERKGCQDNIAALNKEGLRAQAAIQVCYNRGVGYRLGDKIKLNCNQCICKKVLNGYYNFVCENSICLVQPNLIEVINKGKYGWYAGNYTFFWGLTLKQGFRRRLGTKRAPRLVRGMSAIRVHSNEVLPEVFDSRAVWPRYILPPRDQGNCASSWAFSTTSVASDRLAIQSDGAIIEDLSPQNLLACHSHSKRKLCGGRRVDRAWWYLRRRGVVSTECYPYTAAKARRKRRCRISSRSNRSCPSRSGSNRAFKTTPTYRIRNNEREIMKEIKDNGPVQAIMRVTRDFFSYKGGIYNPLPSAFHEGAASPKADYHSVKIVGWGVKINKLGAPVKFWIVQNSWGEGWGEGGYFRITKGTDASGIESMVLGVWVKLEETMSR